MGVLVIGSFGLIWEHVGITLETIWFPLGSNSKCFLKSGLVSSGVLQDIPGFSRLLWAAVGLVRLNVGNYALYPLMVHGLP